MAGEQTHLLIAAGHIQPAVGLGILYDAAQNRSCDAAHIGSTSCLICQIHLGGTANSGNNFRVEEL